MTHHTHLRAWDLHPTPDTCAHRLLPAGAASRCPRPPEFTASGYLACGTHLVAVVRAEHDRGNPDVVVRRLL